ncbi:MAG: hypothetical protein ACKO96_36695 [Flammeovirgaceae bacterium]
MFRNSSFAILIAMLGICSKAPAQVTPNLTKGDYYMPYYSESEKRDKLGKARARTSQELNPELYKYVNEDPLAHLRGTPSDPANVFRNKAVIGFPQSAPQQYSSQQSEENKREMAAYEADLAAYEAQKQYKEQRLQEALKELETPTIIYNLGTHNGSDALRFAKAYSELEAMLSGKQKVDFLKAAYLVESAVDKYLTWTEFNGMFQHATRVISALMVQDKVSPTDNLSKLMAIYKFMSDTTSVYLPGSEKKTISKPMMYDFEDFKAEKDITKVFVSKLLRTGSGQCMSLPLLYYLFAKAFGAEAYLSFSPQHSHITFKDNVGNWQNIELTGRIFATNDFYWSSGFIKGEQVKSGIYLRPISEKETIAYLLTTLALSYVKTFGMDERVLDVALTARQYSPKSLTASMIVAGYAKAVWTNIQRQYETLGLGNAKLLSDTTAMAIKSQKEKAVNFVLKDLGYAEVPDWAYKQWLDGVNQLAMKQKHLVKRRQLEQQLKRK